MLLNAHSCHGQRHRRRRQYSSNRERKWEREKYKILYKNCIAINTTKKNIYTTVVTERGFRRHLYDMANIMHIVPCARSRINLNEHMCIRHKDTHGTTERTEPNEKHERQYEINPVPITTPTFRTWNVVIPLILRVDGISLSQSFAWNHIPPIFFWRLKTYFSLFSKLIKLTWLLLILLELT